MCKGKPHGVMFLIIPEVNTCMPPLKKTFPFRVYTYKNFVPTAWLTND